MLKDKVAPTLVYLLAQLLNASLRTQVIGLEHLDPKKRYIYCFWHGNQFLPDHVFPRPGEQAVALVSPSRDGQLLTSLLKHYEIDCVRGSSSRRGASALRHLIRKAQAGFSIGMTPDGPRGPRYQVKPGIVFLAKKSGLEIVPIGSAYQHAWTLKKAWDHFVIPKPFSKAVCFVSKPLVISSELDTEQAQALVLDAIHSAEMSAKKQLLSAV
jgi:lysophospholipid acyltransferase (LPLAT)-like uncharacterized protein